MKKIILISLVLSACTAAQINQAVTDANQVLGTPPPLTSNEVSNGLKEALVKGISQGADLASQADGYFKNPKIKIPFPPDAQKVEDKLRALGLNDQVDRFILTLNRGAEDAAKEAKPIFIEAIQSMTINDAWGILKGQNDAATQYLMKTTTAQLKARFSPVIQQSLNKVSAARYYEELVDTYNKIPFTEKVNPDLNTYATNLAIQGLFTLIAQEEKNIRENPTARTTDLLKRVFSAK
ncbi:MAG: DUF4197 domain-containing protein [Bacteroidetes bacterium]|nr:DUF4197 domain-containing protein [Bacteroidota bacterium]